MRPTPRARHRPGRPAARGAARTTPRSPTSSEAGDPTATLFTNDIAQTAAGQGRLTVRHVAAAPAVDVLAGGTAVITNLTNPDEQVLNLAAGTVSASVAATGTTDPVIGPADVDVAEGVNTIVYAWGSLEDDNLALAVQTIDGLHSTPDGVPAGTAGSRRPTPRQRRGHLGGDRRGDPRRSRARLRGHAAGATPLRRSTESGA